ncbi:MAG: hypothetical protein PHH41_00035 [Sulfurimonas sp.]|jgi:hypothetical protein|nr:hypothetical protein [Sulfurimonas sp.]MDD3059313.1 hypothetical protein [Sulfurimonas sp.]MDD5201507.1 hypothetical protein [Sulfurimonas sp.]
MKKRYKFTFEYETEEQESKPMNFEKLLTKAKNLLSVIGKFIEFYSNLKEWF